jgi:hypothetical protein
MQATGVVARGEGNASMYTILGEGDDFVTNVINVIAREGIRVRGFRTEMPTLEDVFLKLTGHGIRD